ncbi:DEAD/DEAH box helicase (plasmid) [Halorutilales archaeon Cl-col2-1]
MSEDLSSIYEDVRDIGFYAGQIELEKTIEGNSPTFGDTEDVVNEVGKEVLDSIGIDRLYKHQTEAIDAVNSGDNIVIDTPTASGKTMTYAIPMIEEGYQDNTKSIYIAPQNSLVNDQTESIREMTSSISPSPFDSDSQNLDRFSDNNLPPGSVSVARYTGQLSQTEKRNVRNEEPEILLSNPEMLHMSVLPYAETHWRWLFENLRYVVLDEVHRYRGYFGIHLSLILRRLKRKAETFGRDLQFLCASATIQNPIEHASRVTGEDDDSFTHISEDYSASGDKHWMFWQPPEKDSKYTNFDSESGDSISNRKSSHSEATDIFSYFVIDRYQTLVFTRARQGAEYYSMVSQRRLQEMGHNDLAEKVTAYEGALTDDRREEIEEGLKSGDTLGVWSTNALELGVDIGGLDVVILDGYPKTVMSTFQRAGRAGRGKDDSAVVLVAGNDSLDQYILRNPDDLFEGDPERAMVNPANEKILKDHLACAASENPLELTDRTYFPSNFIDIVEEMIEEGRLEEKGTKSESESGSGSGSGSDSSHTKLETTEDGPHYSMAIRDIDSQMIQIVDKTTGSNIAELQRRDAYRDAHRGAYYTHQDQNYKVENLDLKERPCRSSPY